jgi:hypothetical protein
VLLGCGSDVGVFAFMEDLCRCGDYTENESGKCDVCEYLEGLAVADGTLEAREVVESIVVSRRR